MFTYIGMSYNKRLERAARAREIISILSEWWPGAFSIYERARRPIKVGIHLDILAVAGGAITAAELGHGLQYYCTNRAYLLACCRPGAARVDLSGNVAGIVAPEEAANASIRLQRLARKRRKTSNGNGAKAEVGNGTEPDIKRLSLKDLRAAALARKARPDFPCFVQRW
jgi:sRNA-binding protein